jgi:outer membrane protein OmpA-like peptidoglycan-associated protein
MATPAPAGPLPVAVPAMAEMRVLLNADVVFAFDRSDRAAIRAGGLDRLDALLRRIVTEQLDIVSVRVIGHADRLNSTGDRQYNLRLSERRAKTVRDLLVGRSIAATAISVGAEGDTAPVDRCGDKTRDTPDLEECLLPNRRVEVALTAVRRP